MNTASVHNCFGHVARTSDVEYSRKHRRKKKESAGRRSGMTASRTDNDGNSQVQVP